MNNCGIAVGMQSPLGQRQLPLAQQQAFGHVEAERAALVAPNGWLIRNHDKPRLRPANKKPARAVQ